MRPKKSAADFLPERRTLPALREAAKTCEGCELYKRATQTIFGEGPRKAPLMMVGETPGDKEDIAGRPFVGPAGHLLDEALEHAGINRDNTYVTNAVKHFAWEERGKRRLHKKPRWGEVQACKPWLIAEIEVVAPEIIVCMGATAAQSLMGSAFRITKVRGEILTCDWAPHFMATYHPSAILRAPEKEDRDRMRDEFFEDVVRAASVVPGLAAVPLRNHALH
jgi:uracil-DNA glycosylase